MQLPTSPQELVDHIIANFHDAHRRDLAVIMSLAGAVETCVPGSSIGASLSVMRKILEQHMFKEEMRLFPLMLQGGNGLIGRLLDDMQAEHNEHRRTARSLRVAMAELLATGAAAQEIALLHDAVMRLLESLEQHMSIEDDVLFALFREP